MARTRRSRGPAGPLSFGPPDAGYAYWLRHSV